MFLIESVFTLDPVSSDGVVSRLKNKTPKLMTEIRNDMKNNDFSSMVNHFFNYVLLDFDNVQGTNAMISALKDTGDKQKLKPAKPETLKA
jgi:hypothetical protein